MLCHDTRVAHAGLWPCMLRMPACLPACCTTIVPLLMRSAKCLSCVQPKLVLPTPTPGLLAVDPAVAWVQPVLR